VLVHEVSDDGKLTRLVFIAFSEKIVFEITLRGDEYVIKYRLNAPGFPYHYAAMRSALRMLDLDGWHNLSIQDIDLHNLLFDPDKVMMRLIAIFSAIRIGVLTRIWSTIRPLSNYPIPLSMQLHYSPSWADYIEFSSNDNSCRFGGENSTDLIFSHVNILNFSNDVKVDIRHELAPSWFASFLSGSLAWSVIADIIKKEQINE